MLRNFKVSIVTLLLAFTFLSSLTFVFARGGGGGSSSGGGGGGGGSSYHSSSYSNSNSPRYQHGNCSDTVEIETEEDCLRGQFMTGVIILPIAILILIIRFFGDIFNVRFSFFNIFRKSDPLLSAKAEEIYYQFQKAWSEFDMVTLEKITSKKYYDQLALELAVLKNEGRENRMTEVKLFSAFVDSEKYKSTEVVNSYIVEINGKAHDVLYDVGLSKELYTDSSMYKEYWTVVMEQGEYRLDSIRQSTEDIPSIRENVAEFARKNAFFYNPDFGWLMLPNKGDLFSGVNFKTTDVNNHVIGVYKNKIVEFYSINFNGSNDEYFIGQAILPKSYSRIVIRRKNMFSMFERGVSGLRKIEMESVVFNKEFEVYSDKLDTMTTFELLHPVYMEYIMGLPYKVNIEVVGNVVYFYTNAIEVNYGKLLEILSRAFDEIKE